MRSAKNNLRNDFSQNLRNDFSQNSLSEIVKNTTELARKFQIESVGETSRINRTKEFLSQMFFFSFFFRDLRSLVGQRKESTR